LLHIRAAGAEDVADIERCPHALVLRLGIPLSVDRPLAPMCNTFEIFVVLLGK